MLDTISATVWFPSQEPAECPVCAAARAGLSAAGVAAAGELAVDLLARAEVAAIARSAIAACARHLPAARISLLVPETAGRWRVFASSTEKQMLDLVVESERCPDLVAVRRTGAPSVGRDSDLAGPRDAWAALAATGVGAVAAFPVVATAPGAEPVVLRVLFHTPVTDEHLALATLAAHQLSHRLARIPATEVAAQFGTPPPTGTTSDAASLLNLLPLPAVVVDAGGAVWRANRRAVRLLGTGDQGVPAALSLTPATGGNAPRWDASLATANGRLHVLAWESRLAGDRRLVLLEAHPEARRRAYERAIRHTLADKLRELERANERLAENARLRERFVSDAAHELKTPLAILRSYLETLADDLGAGLTEQQLEFLQAATVGASRLQRLVDGLLDLAALEAGRLPLGLGPVASGEVVAAVLDELHPIAAAAGIVLTAIPAPEVVVRADRERLAQVLRNLTENGIKYNRDGGAVRIAVDASGDHGVITVDDTGVGIRPEDLSRIFDEFVRIGSTHHAEGAGLGLAIVRRLVLAMGGRVWADSTPGRGSRFSVELPVWTGEG